MLMFQDLMNREKKDKIPSMQVGFIDAICLELYEVGCFVLAVSVYAFLLTIKCNIFPYYIFLIPRG